ncbi:MAG TPA: MFS transporter, partial [Reyranella sp.]|nr:MFS transporter [Reyranella sp.]
MGLIKELRPTLPILIGAAIMLSLSGGIRQSFGLIMPPLTRDIAVSVSDFALAMSVQNLAWGFLQPVAGALAVRVGFRPVMLGAGVLIGLALACTASAIALAVGSRAVPSHWRSLVLGAITASGSLGALLSAPLGQWLAVD